MKPFLFIAAVPLLMGFAFAQDNTNTNTNANSSSSSSAPAAQSTNSTTATTTQTTTSTGTTGATQVKTETFKGTLVDASCAMGGGTAASTSTSGAARSAAADNTATPAAPDNSNGGKSKKHKGEANRGASDQGQSCAVSSSTSQFALKTKDGRTLRFDEVGNERAQQVIKDKKKWNEAASSGKPIHAKVSGVMNGDQVTVMSID